MKRTMVLLVRFESVMHLQCLPSSAKQQREMTKWYVIWKKYTASANFSLSSFGTGRCHHICSPSRF